jgi:hypothetical protein
VRSPPPPPITGNRDPPKCRYIFARLHDVTFLMTIILKTTKACNDVPGLTPRTRVLLQKLGVPICKGATNCPLRNLSLVYTPLTPAYRYSCLSTARQAIQGVSRLVDITAGGDFLGLCDQKSSYKHVSDFGRLRSYGHFLISVHALL